MTTQSIPPNQNGSNNGSGDPITPLAAWLLMRFAAGGPPIADLGKLQGATALEAWSAMAGATDRQAALRAWSATIPDGAAVVAAIFAADPFGPEPQDAPPPAPAPPRLVLHSADEAFDDEEDIDWVVRGVFSRGSVSLCFGKPGAKKTWLLLDAGVHVAAGLEWLGRVVQQGPVLLIDEESGPRRMRRRLRRLLDAHQLGRGQPIHFSALAALNLASDPIDVVALDEQLGQLKPSLVVIDALIDVSGGADENAAGDMQRLMQALRALAEKHQCAIVLIHHSGKAGQYRGSSAILGAVDLALEITSEPDSANVDIRSEKARDVEAFALSATFKRDDILGAFGTIDFIPTKVTAKAPHLSKSEAYVIRWLTDHKSQSMEDIKSHADTCSAEAARKAVYSLADRNLVRRSDAGGPGVKALYDLVPPTP